MEWYNIDVNTTTSCSFRCSYCIETPFFEKGKHFNKTDELIKFIDNLLNHEYFKNFGVSIGFWGGESTLRIDTMNTLINHYIDNDRVKFLIYTNGYQNLDKLPLFELKDKKIEGHPKIFTQISYDGLPIHDKNRKDKFGNKTSTKVLKSIDYLFSNNIPCGLKSTVPISDFKYMCESYLDILSLYEKYDLNNGGSYFPTIDYLTKHKLTEQNQIQYVKDLKESLIKIAKYEIKYYQKNGRFFFRWFNDSRAICSAGKHLCAIDTDGRIVNCHGCLYHNDLDVKTISWIDSDESINNIINNINRFEDILSKQPIECAKCETTFCLRCNSTKYELSTKETFEEKWIDYDNQPYLCDYYKMVGKVKKSINKILNENKG